MVEGAADYVLKDNLGRLGPAVRRELQNYEEFKHQELLLEASYELANIGHWELDVETEELFWSAQVKRLHDVPEDFEPDLQTALQFYKGEEHKKKISKLFEEAMEHGTGYTVELPIVTAKGDTRWIRTVGDTVKKDGNIVQVYGSAQDITKRKTSQQQLEETKNKLRDIVEHSTNLFYRYDTDFNLTYISPQAQQFLGCHPEKAMGDWTDFITEHPKNKKGIALTKEAIETGKAPPAYELQIKSLDGEPRWVQVNEAPIVEDGQTVAMVGSLSDITDLKKSHKTQRKLSMVASETQNIVIITDTDGCIEWVNEAFTDVTGYTEEEVLGKKPGDFLQGERTDPETVKRLSQKFDTGEPYFEEVLNYTKDGEPYWVKMDVKPIRNNQGEIERYFAIQEDITERKHRVQKLQEKARRLQWSQKIGDIGDWKLDVEAQSVFWSENMYTIYDRELDKGPPSYEELMEYYPDEEERQDHIEKVEQAIEQGTTYSLDIKMKTDRGNIKYLHVEGFPNTNESGQTEQLLGIVQDITEEKELEKQLREQVVFATSIIDSLPGLFYMIDSELNFVRANTNVYQLFNFNEDQLPKIDPLSLIAPRERDVIKQKINEVMETGYAETETVMLVDGNERHFYLNGRLVEVEGQSYILGNGIDITERVMSQKDNEVLLKEVHHRVKNNLAIISGLLQLEMENTQYEVLELPFQRSINRIQSMAKVHELLYNSSQFSSINLEKYLDQVATIVEETLGSNKQDIDIIINIDDIEVNINTGIPLGMLTNELITNSFKYAFGKEGGEITLMVKKENQYIEVVYRDNGKGIEGDFELSESNTLGMRIIDTLLMQLQADFELKTDNQFELTFQFEESQAGSHGNI